MVPQKPMNAVPSRGRIRVARLSREPATLKEEE